MDGPPYDAAPQRASEPDPPAGGDPACKRCGGINAGPARFCGDCGADLGAGAPPQQWVELPAVLGVPVEGPPGEAGLGTPAPAAAAGSPAPRPAPAPPSGPDHSGVGAFVVAFVILLVIVGAYGLSQRDANGGTAASGGGGGGGGACSSNYGRLSISMSGGGYVYVDGYGPYQAPYVGDHAAGQHRVQGHLQSGTLVHDQYVRVDGCKTTTVRW